MDDSYADEALTDAEAAFRQTRGQTGESDLDVSDAALVQLRKACRLLEAARTLREQNGYYTVVIEASFVAVERSIQFYLLHRGHASGEDLRYEHTAVYQQGAEVNLFSEEFADRLTQLWKQNRAEVYYRETVASAEQADAMLSLTDAVHRYIWIMRHYSTSVSVPSNPCEYVSTHRNRDHRRTVRYGQTE